MKAMTNEPPYGLPPIKYRVGNEEKVGYGNEPDLPQGLWPEWRAKMEAEKQKYCQQHLGQLW